MRFTEAVIGSLLVLAWTSGAMAILVEDYVAIRILEPPEVHPPPDCQTVLVSGHDCGAGPGFAGGISNDGDVFGILETDFPHRNSLHDAGRWLRSTNYKGENVRRMVLDGAGPGGLAYGYLRVRKVAANGLAWGAGNPGLVSYDIQNDEWKYFGIACAGGGNSKGRGVAGCHAIGDEPDADEYPRVVDVQLVGDEPFTGAERGDLYRFADDARAQDINDSDIIVGHLSVAGGCVVEVNGQCLFSDPNRTQPIKIVPDGEDRWGEPILMDQLDPNGNAQVDRISDSDPAYGIGFSVDGSSTKQAAVWNVNTGQIVAADFGRNIEFNAINTSGTMIVGSQTVFGFPSRVHRMWWTDDGWQTWSAIDPNDILPVAEGGEHIAEITKLTGVNDKGQMSGQALLAGEFGEYATPGVSAWSSAVALNPDCPTSDPGEWRPGNGCGIPVLLDTLPLTPMVVLGDVNDDGSVNNLDITTFIGALSAADEAAFLTQFSNGNYAAADVDMSGTANNLDITPFIGLLTAAGSNATAVPEPGSLACIALALMMGRRRAARR